MKKVTAAQVWSVDNVTNFKGFDVQSGEVDLRNSEYVDYLNEIYPEVEICGGNYSAGSALESLDPTAFRCGKGDYESELQTELEAAIESEDDSDITFGEFDPSDINEDEEEDEENL